MSGSNTWLPKYLKYKNKYLNLVKLYKQRGNGENFSWFLDNTMLEHDEETELEGKYNEGTADTINFRGIDYTADTGGYVNGGNRLTRQQKIMIQPNEKLLFDKLREYAVTLPVTLRVAGGWVRDKIIGLPNDDIDIALDTMSGEEFSKNLCSAINGNLGNRWEGWECKLILASAAGSKSEKLAPGKLLLTFPDKSIIDLDFVGLRSEVYDGDSRVPIVQAATAIEDASRRDLTINSLFYNINLGLVEDYMGGVKDIKRKLIRTPLDPTVSFRNDPLRMLRALRFHSRFHFKLDPSITTAMSNPALHADFMRKISRTRVGQEIEGFFNGSSNPLLAFQVIYDTNLWGPIFGGEHIVWTVESKTKSMELLARLEDRSKVTVLAALTYPLAEIDIGLPIVKKVQNNVQKFCSEILRFTSDLSDTIQDIHRCIFSILDLSDNMALWHRSDIALILFDSQKLFGIALNIIKAINPEKYAKILQFIGEHKISIEEVKAIKLKFNPKDVMAQFEVTGKDLKILLNKLLIWNLDKPDGTFEEALAIKDSFKNP
jgi:tRNA nucleotidyltransferase/poly(A) polymerase